MEISIENRLLQAILKDDLEAVRRYLSKGANPNKTVVSGKTCLGEAAYKGYTDIVLELIAASHSDASKHAGTNEDASTTTTKSLKNRRKKSNPSSADENKPSKQGYYVMCHEDSSSEEGRVGAALSPACPPPDLEWDDEEVNVAATTSEDESTTIMYKWYAAILESTGAAIAAASDYTCGVDQQDSAGRTALYHAVDNGHNDIVNALIKAGCKLDLAGSCGQSPLHLAVASRRMDIVKSLLEAGANVNITTPKKTTPLHIAASKELRMVTLIVEHGALLDARDARDRTALFLAASRGRTDIVKFLISRGANINIGDGDGHTPLCEAVSSKYHKTVKVLLSSGARITHFQCLLHNAVMERDMEMLELLAQHGCGINVHNCIGETPLLLTMTLSDPYPFAKILLENGANVDACNSHTGARVLHAAVEYNNRPEEFEPLLLLLLRYSVDINKRASTRDTALNRAALLHKDKVAMQLIRHGADVNLCEMLSNFGLFGNLIVASHRRSTKLADMLLKAGHNRYAVETSGNTNRTAMWINEQCRMPLSLLDACRIRVRGMRTCMLIEFVASLPVPEIIKDFLMMNEFT